MRTLVFALALLATLYSGYWFAAASQIQAQSEAALADLKAKGWEIDHADLSTTGFPLRFDTVMTDLSIASPDGQILGTAPFLRIFADSYHPVRVDVVSPEARALVMAGQEFDISAKDLRASSTVTLSSHLPLERATVGSGPMELGNEGGWALRLDRLTATAHSAGPAAYDLFVEANGLQPAIVSSHVDLLRIAARVALDQPLGLRSTTPPRFESVVIQEVRIAQGDVALTGRGELRPDAQGYLTGTVILAVENWRGLLDLLQSAGFLVFEQRVFLEGALVEMSGGSDRIELPVTFADGQVEALGMTLLPAPRVL